MHDTIFIQLGLNSNKLYVSSINSKNEYEKNTSKIDPNILKSSILNSRSIFIDHSQNFPDRNLSKIYEIRDNIQEEIDIPFIEENAVIKESQPYWIDQIVDKYHSHKYYPIPDKCSSDAPYSKLVGSLEFINSQLFKNDIEESIRQLSESSDYVSSFQIMTDMDDGLGLSTKYLLDHLSDEYRHRAKLVIGSYSAPLEDVKSRAHQVFYSCLITNYVLTCPNAMLIPFSPVSEISMHPLSEYNSTSFYNVESYSERMSLFSYVLNTVTYPSLEEGSLPLYDIIDGVRCSSWGSDGCMATCGHVPFLSVSSTSHIFRQFKPDIITNFEDYCCLTPNMKNLITSDFNYQLIILNDHPSIDTRVFSKDIEHIFWRSQLRYGPGYDSYTKESILSGYLNYMYDGCVSDTKCCPYYNLKTSYQPDSWRPSLTSLFTGKCHYQPIVKSMKNLSESWKRISSYPTFQQLEITSDLINEYLNMFHNTCEILDPVATFDME